jgi:hypothetical protein
MTLRIPDYSGERPLSLVEILGRIPGEKAASELPSDTKRGLGLPQKGSER